MYDPTTGEVRSPDTDHIALWMIDTNYNEESFFVRHAYFTGGHDPYKRLKRALKAEIDEDAWATPLPHRQPALPATRDRQDRRQGHQRLRRRGPEGLRRLGAPRPARSTPQGSLRLLGPVDWPLPSDRLIAEGLATPGRVPKRPLPG